MEVLMPGWRCEQCETTWLITEEDTQAQHCPVCGSTDVWPDGRFGVEVQPAALAIDGTMPLWECTSCRAQWIMTDGGLSGAVEHCVNCGYHAIDLVGDFGVETHQVAFLQSERRPSDGQGAPRP